MGPTLSELIDDVRHELSETDPDFFTDTVVTNFLNEAQDAIVLDVPSAAVDTQTTATVAGSSRYQLPENFVLPRETWIKPETGDEHRLHYLEPDQMDRKWRSSTSSGRGWVTYRSTRLGTEMEILPVPSVTGLLVTVTASIRPRALVDTTDRTDIDGRYAYLLKAYALGRCKRKDEENSQADRYMAEFNAEIARLSEIETKLQADQFNRTRVGRHVSRYFGEEGILP
jgi:hypothetical protein